MKGDSESTCSADRSQGSKKDAAKPCVSARSFLSGERPKARNTTPSGDVDIEHIAEPSVSSFGSTNLSTPFDLSEEETSEERRQRIGEKVANAIREQEQKQQDFPKLIKYRQSMVEVRLRSNNDKGKLSCRLRLFTPFAVNI